MNKSEVGLLYLSLHNQLVKKHGFTTITRREFFTKLGKHYMVPKEIRHIIIDEMEKRKLISRINRDNLQILNCSMKLI